ncbi:MAG: Ig-like domain-containing protein [Candidatus Eisenbacteria bacterium]|nr:Ig-like domain-containing protein [Candidatus Eisenbacteria bacterium]
MRAFMAALAALLVLPAVALAAGHITGNFQGWNPNDPNYELSVNANGVYVLTKSLDAGAHQYKAVDGNAWGQDFPSANQSFSLSGTGNVTWYVNFGAVVGTRQGDEYVFHSMNPPIVCGDFMSELGGSDWDQTNTTLTVMSDPDGDDVWEWQSVIPAGNYQFKIVLNNNWAQNTSTSGNRLFSSNGSTPVLFRYHMVNNLTEVFTAAPPTVVSARVKAACPVDTGVLEVKFSKAVEETSAETATNYTVGGRVYTVLTATRDPLQTDTVYLEVSPDLVEGDDYTVTVTGVTDLDGRPVDPSNNTACFFLHKVVFEVHMELYAQANGVPTSVHIQGDTYPLTWDQCGGCQTYDDGTNGDAVAGDRVYTVVEYFSLGYACGGSASSAQVKYKYIVDCTTWEGDYEFGHYVTLDPNAASQTMNVWWEDVAPSDNISCDVGVRFQVTNAPTCGYALYVRGNRAPLDWSTGIVLRDDGTGGDLTSGDGIYSALVVFPTGTHRQLEYKYFCADSQESGVYECDTYPNRALTLDDVNHCVMARGPMEFVDLWGWCAPVATVPEGEDLKSWGRIKSLYR